MRSVLLHRPSPGTLDRLGPVLRFLLIWAPALIGIAAIATESTPTFSAANTSSWLRPVAERFFGHISTDNWEEFHHILRKTGHFLGYGTLCVLFVRGWLLTLAAKLSLSNSVWRLRSWLFGVLSTTAVASADEIHQTFLPSRTGLFSDVVLDTCGGIALSGIVLTLAWLIRRLQLADRQPGSPENSPIHG